MSVPEVELQIVYLPVAAVHPNLWNPNRQREAVRRAQRESLERYGVIQPITVRPHPERDGEWQIINGEHRWTDAQELGLESLPAIVLDDIDEGDARKLTLVLNETAGDPDAALLGQMLLELKSMQGDDLPLALPYTSDELDHLLEMGGALHESPPAQQAKDPNLERQVHLAFLPERHRQFNDLLLVLKTEWSSGSVSDIVFEAVKRAALAAHHGS